MQTILIADDEPNLRLLVSTTLSDPALRILEAEDGEAAIAMAREHHPDLLILDWMMPRMAGIEVAAALKGDPLTAGTPVVMLTAKAQEADRQRGAAVGVDRYLTKPFSPLQLLQVVDELLGVA